MPTYISDKEDFKSAIGIDDLGSVLENLKDSIEGNYRKGVNTFLEFIYTHADTTTSLTRELIEDWIVDMGIRGITLKTAIHYLDIISALYPFGKLEDENTDKTFFKTIKQKLKKNGFQVWDSNITLKDLYSVITLVNSANRLNKDVLAADLLRMALSNSRMSIYQIATLKKTELDVLGESSLPIAEKYISPTRKYVFPLQQSEITVRQLQRSVDQKIVKLMQHIGVNPMWGITAFIDGIRALAALKAGIPAHKVISLFPDAIKSLPILTVCTGTPYIPEEQKYNFYHTVNQAFVQNPEHWYALHLRKGISFDNLTDKLDANKELISLRQLFYPMQEITRKVKNRLVFKETPVLPGIVFFKSRPIDVSEIFRNIGSMAWGYKNGDRYAAISDREMTMFQESIGYFTADTEIKPIGAIELQPNDNVIIIGGMLAGMEGRYKNRKEIKQSEGGRTIFRLLLPSDNGIEWVVDVDSRLVKKTDNKTTTKKI